jgi:hypothetical protein
MLRHRHLPAACIIGLVWLFGCSESADVPPEAPRGKEPPATIPQPGTDIVVQARLYKGRGPSYELDDQVVEAVVRGKLPFSAIAVWPKGDQRFFSHLPLQKLYTLRLRLSEKSNRQLQENTKKDGDGYLVVNGEEIERITESK